MICEREPSNKKFLLVNLTHWQPKWWSGNKEEDSVEQKKKTRNQPYRILKDPYLILQTEIVLLDN